MNFRINNLHFEGPQYVSGNIKTVHHFRNQDWICFAGYYELASEVRIHSSNQERF
jgi:hypothetical protein